LTNRAAIGDHAGMEILLLRHGIAVDAEEAGSDDARRLSREGRKRVRRAAAMLRKLGIAPNAIITSPLPRAKETADVTAWAIRFKGEVQVAAQLTSGASPQDYIAVLNEAGESEQVMLVGHNPDMEDFLQYLIAPKSKVCLELKKGGLAIVEIAGLKKLSQPGRGVLKTLYTAKDLVRLAG
jgi:phosphohistidine phosphatase